MSPSLVLIFGVVGMCQIADTRTITSLKLSQGFYYQAEKQALGSDIMAVLVVNAPPPTLPWEIDWILHDKESYHVLGTIVLLPSMKTKFEPFEGGRYQDRFSVGITPSVLSSPYDEIRSVLTFHNLLESDTGYKLGVYGEMHPHQYLEELHVSACGPKQGRAIILQPERNCGYKCLADYVCEYGYLKSDSYKAECLASAKWNLTETSCVKNRLEHYEFVPASSRDIYAVAFVGLMVHVRVRISGINYCSWQYEGGEWSDANFFDSRVCSEEYLSGTKESISCFVFDGYLYSNLTFKQPLQFGKMSVGFACQSIAFLERDLSILYCPPGQSNVIITHRAEHCGYGCVGRYSCSEGLIPLNSRPVVCTVTADWNVTVSNCVTDLLRSWQVYPLDERTYSVGFEDLIVNINIENQMLGGCMWRYGGELDDIELMKPGGACKKRIWVGVNETITCYSKDGILSSNLTFHEALRPGNLHTVLTCDLIPYLDEFIAVKYCPSRQHYAIINYAASVCEYKCQGFYDCPIGFQRFGTGRAVCTAVAKWNITQEDCAIINTAIFAESFNSTDNGGSESTVMRCKAKKLLTVLFFITNALALLNRATL